MSGLETAFYIMAIIFMAVMFILITALVVAVFVIRSKINKIHTAIEDKIQSVTSIAEKGGEVAAKAVSGFARQTKRALNKK
jgi:hypothetical protein